MSEAEMHLNEITVQTAERIEQKLSSNMELINTLASADFSRLCFFPVKRRGYKFSRAVPLPGGRGGGVGRTLAFP